ncbi:endonuclease domain of the non-LTR retrotransposon LINE-1 [Elysia marginata]|uniref:Endonuclease domain of the non-LTR retrotransposon LINE-1 n=1 Tax=Elysia marginata TaxID=1093978 RepID=A0AAV4H216_9GAST|nr:endonuclease domain of the non-LTR retrotransposon LINE-1 [Elysia marginata]
MCGRRFFRIVRIEESSGYRTHPRQPSDEGRAARNFEVMASADNETAATTIAEAVNQQLTQSPGSVVLITGDMNTCMQDPYIPRFHQYVECPTRNNKTLDKCYINLNNAYKSKQLPSLGDSDHLMIELLPTYKTVMKRMPVVSKKIKLWDEDGCERLRGCLECTDWNVFFTKAVQI